MSVSGGIKQNITRRREKLKKTLALMPKIQVARGVTSNFRLFS
jgi:hypothetical protein